jgi:hypothetical protein
MMLMPVSDSPRIIAQWIGAAPRYLGKQRAVNVDRLMPMQVDHRLADLLPERDDHQQVAAARRHLFCISGVLMFAASTQEMPCGRTPQGYIGRLGVCDDAPRAAPAA